MFYSANESSFRFPFRKDQSLISAILMDSHCVYLLRRVAALAHANVFHSIDLFDVIFCGIILMNSE